MFDFDRFIEDCRDAVRRDPSHRAAREVLVRANTEPEAILAALMATGAGVALRTYRATGGPMAAA